MAFLATLVSAAMENELPLTCHQTPTIHPLEFGRMLLDNWDHPEM